jgi:hypothetical protein
VDVDFFNSISDGVYFKIEKAFGKWANIMQYTPFCKDTQTYAKCIQKRFNFRKFDSYVDRILHEKMYSFLGRSRHSCHEENKMKW